MPLSFTLSRCIQHILNENPVPSRGVIHQNMRHSAHQFAVPNDRHLLTGDRHKVQQFELYICTAITYNKINISGRGRYHNGRYSSSKLFYQIMQCVVS